MKFLLTSLVQISGKVNLRAAQKVYVVFYTNVTPLLVRIHEKSNFLIRYLYDFLESIRVLGFIGTMEEYEKRKLGLFNILNFFQFITGIIVPISGLLNHQKLGMGAWILACLPALTSVLVLILNHAKRYDTAILTYFALYPVLTSIIYLSGMNLGLELFFILYGILAVFFIQDTGHMIFSIALSMISYFVLTVVWRNFQFQLEVQGGLFLFNHLLAMSFIFYGLYLIKQENSGYQESILNKNEKLHLQFLEIQSQKKALSKSTRLLQQQAEELTELNSIKNKLFSVIAHDLKTPMYGLRNLFSTIEAANLPAEEVREILPDVIKDLNHTVSLMDNLLEWAKSQMQTNAISNDEINISELTHEVILVVKLQAQTKKITLRNSTGRNEWVQGDKEMIRLVLRNLITNAIKFSPPQGVVSIGTREHGSKIEIFVQDDGVGISPEALEKIQSSQYYTTNGTSSETGTGVGLMLCKEFLVKNQSSLKIQSAAGKGSRFSFVLPRLEC